MRACAASAAAIRSAMAMQAAAMGWWVANQVRPMAMVSPAVLRAMLETGSGLGVIAARTAVLEVWEASAMAAPKVVARICIVGESCELAW